MECFGQAYFAQLQKKMHFGIKNKIGANIRRTSIARLTGMTKQARGRNIKPEATFQKHFEFDGRHLPGLLELQPFISRWHKVWGINAEAFVWVWSFKRLIDLWHWKCQKTHRTKIPNRPFILKGWRQWVRIVSCCLLRWFHFLIYCNKRLTQSWTLTNYTTIHIRICNKYRIPFLKWKIWKFKRYWSICNY